MVSLLSGKIEHLRLGEITAIPPSRSLEALRAFPAESFDLVLLCPPFDPMDRVGPFRLDDQSRGYIERWSECIAEASRLVAPTGGMMIYGLPKYLPFFGVAAGKSLSFRSWLAVNVWHDPIKGSPLVPSQAGLLFHVRDLKRSTVNRIRQPHPKCTACENLLSDWGGHKDKCNPAGVTMSDVWLQISGETTLVPNLPDGALLRALAVATKPGDSVLFVCDLLEEAG